MTLPAFLFNPIGDSFSFSPLVLHSAVSTSAFNSSFGAGDTGWSNSIRYTTPSFSGATANVYYRLGKRIGDNAKKNVGGNVLYFNGPLSLTVACHDVAVGNPTDNVVANGIVTAPNVAKTPAFEQKLWFVGGACDFNLFTLYTTCDQAKHDIDLRDKTGSLGLATPTGGAGKVLAAVAQTRRTGVAPPTQWAMTTACPSAPSCMPSCSATRSPTSTTQTASQLACVTVSQVASLKAA